MSEPAVDQPSVGKKRGRGAIALQLFGFVVSIALLSWCVAIAFEPGRREQLLSALRESPASLLWLTLLSLLSLIINGFAFALPIRRLHRLRVVDVTAVNAIASLLNMLPMKLSVAFRVMVHFKRDGVGLVTIAAWFAAVAGILFATALPILAARVLFADSRAWVFTSALGVVLAGVAIVLVSRALSSRAATVRAEAVARRLMLGRFVDLMKSPRLGSVAGAFEMLGDARRAALGVTARLVDIAINTARFSIAATMLGQPTDLSQCAVMAVAYYVVGVLSPAGLLGPREAVVSAISGPLGIADPSAFVAVPLLVTALEVPALLAGAGVSFFVLRPDRLLARQRDKKTSAVSSAP